VTQQFADFGASDLSLAARTAAKHVLLDATGVMLAASGLARETDAFVAVAQMMGPGPCRILGTAQSASPAMAAMANGAMAHALDFEDTFEPAPGHPNASLVPALLALAQMRGGVSGPRFLAALAMGCELSCRMGLALRQPLEAGGWYPPPLLAGYGAALGSAHLLGLSAVQMTDALSLALCQVTMPGEIKHSQRTVIRAIREAFPAQAAVQSALLAEHGVPGFEQPLEGEAGFFALYAGGNFAPDVLQASLAGPLAIEQLTFKPWSSCRGTHPHIELALALRAEHGFCADDIVGIRVGVGPLQMMLVEPAERKRAPQVAIDAKFSIPFCTAAALVTGSIDIDSFDDGQLHSPAILALASRITYIPGFAGAGGHGIGGSIEITLADGRVLQAAQDFTRGCPEKPLSVAELVSKFVACATRAAVPLSQDAAQDLAGRILSLEQCDDVGALFA
jgi:2-methylcitrate dehydratase PrpD